MPDVFLEEMNYVMVRMPIENCDFSTYMYAADNKERDEDFEAFDFWDVEQYMLPLLDWAEAKCGKKAPHHASSMVSAGLHEDQRVLRGRRLL